MSTSDVEAPNNKRNAAPTILRHGFRHPRSEGVSSSDICAKTEPPEIKWKACSWDAIEDEPKEREDEHEDRGTS